MACIVLFVSSSQRGWTDPLPEIEMALDSYRASQTGPVEMRA